MLLIYLLGNTFLLLKTAITYTIHPKEAPFMEPGRTFSVLVNHLALKRAQITRVPDPKIHVPDFVIQKSSREAGQPINYARQFVI